MFNMSSKLIKISKLYKDLGVCRKTLYNWVKQGKIVFVKTPGGHNFVTEETYNDLLHIKNKNKSNKNGDER